MVAMWPPLRSATAYHRLPWPTQQPYGQRCGTQPPWPGWSARPVLRAASGGTGRGLPAVFQPHLARRGRANPADHTPRLLMRTLSKFGLAGVRLGYMMGPQALIAEFDKVRPPYNVSVTNCECALFALEHQDVFAPQAVKSVRSVLCFLKRLARCRRENLAQRRQYAAGCVPDAQNLRWPEGAWRFGQERF